MKTINNNYTTIIIGFLLITTIYVHITDSYLSADDQLTSDSEIDGLTIQTDKDNYEKGKQINVSGTILIENQNNSILSDNIMITFEHGSWRRFTTATITGNNTYNISYNISYGDPEGSWNITAFLSDNKMDSIKAYKKINVSIPSDIIRYKVLWLSPPKEVIYKRGDTFNISIYITENEIGVNNASTTCILPSMEEIKLTEIKQGYYQESYTIPLDSVNGYWSLSITSINTSEDPIKAGGSNTSIYVKPATLIIELLEPSLTEYKSGKNMEIKINLTYQNNHIVKNANVISKLQNNEIKLINRGNGIYSANYSITDENLGRNNLIIEASDKYDNNASISLVVQFIKENHSNLPLTSIFIIIFLIIIAIFSIFFFRKRFFYHRHKDIENEIQEIKYLKNEAAINYFKKGSINRNTYDKLMKEHTIQLTELNKKVSKTHNGEKPRK